MNGTGATNGLASIGSGIAAFGLPSRQYRDQKERSECQSMRKRESIGNSVKWMPATDKSTKNLVAPMFMHSFIFKQIYITYPLVV